MTPARLSIVCPAFNEEEVLPQFHRELAGVLDRLGGDYQTEVIYVDDGSQDGTLATLYQLARQDNRVRFLSFTRNFGQQAALTAGIEAATGDAVITLDCDLQHPPALIPVLLDHWRAGKDVVLTIRQNDTDGLVKRLTSRGFYRILRVISENEIQPAASDFRLLARPAVDAFLRMRETHRFVRGMVHWLGFPSAEIPFAVQRRAAGRTKYTLQRLLNLAADGVISFSRLPLRLVMVLGLLLGGMGIVGTGLGVPFWLTHGGHHLAVAVLLAALCVIGGGILFALGVVGEYVGRIYEQVKGRPLYVVKEMGSSPAAAHRWRAAS